MFCQSSSVGVVSMSKMTAATVFLCAIVGALISSEPVLASKCAHGQLSFYIIVMLLVLS